MLEKFRGMRAVQTGNVADLATAAPERRRNIRLTTVFQVAKIRTEGHEELCILRDISPNGLKAEIYRPIAVGETVTVEFRTGHAVHGCVVWARDSFVGVAFIDAVSVVGILSHSSFDERVGRIRPPRLEVRMPARLRSPEHDVDVEVVDISQAGAKLLVDRAFPPNAICDLWLPLLDRKRGLMRWCRDGTAGLMFAEPIAFRDFAAWRQTLAAQAEQASA